MTFREDSSETFKEFSKSIQDKIKSFEGCKHLNILQDIHHCNIFFSYSHWESEQNLNNYRDSTFFRKTWRQTKQWFSDKPEAWSTEVAE